MELQYIHNLLSPFADVQYTSMFIKARVVWQKLEKFYPIEKKQNIK